MKGVIKHKLPKTREEWLYDRLKGMVAQMLVQF